MLKESINLDNNDTQETSVIKKYKDGLDRNTGQHINDDRSFVVTDSNIDIRNNDYYEKYWMYNFDAPLNTFSYFYYNRNLCDIFSNLSLKASKALNHNSLNIYILSVYPIGAVIINVCTYTNSGYVRSILGSRRYFFEASHLPSSMLIKKYKLLKNTYQAYIQDQAKNTSLDIGKRQISVKKDEPFSIFKNISAFFFNKKSKKRRSNAEASIASTASTGSRSKDFKKLIEINKQKFLDLYVNFIELDEKENIKIRDIDTIMIDEENTVDVYLEECLHNKKNSKNDSDSQSTEKYDNNKNDPEALKNLVKKYGSMVNYITKPLGNLMPTEEFELIKKDYGRNKGILERIKNIRCKKDVNKIFLSLREFYITEFNYYKLMNKFNIGYLKRFLDQRTSSSDKNGMLKKTMFNNIFGHFLEVIKTEQAFLGSLLNNLGVASSDMQKQYLDKEGEKVIEDVISMKFDQMEKGIASGGENINVNFERVVLGVFKSFTQNVKNFKSYKYFCTTYSHSLELIKQNFKHKYIKNVFDKDNIISEIESYFILPVQRIIRYKLYLEGMYKSMFNSDGNGVIHMNNSKITSRAILSIMVEAIRLVAEFLQVLNDDRERYEMGRLAFMVQGKVNNCPSNILTKSRGYITQLPCMLYFSNGSNNKKTQTSNISLFLYTDIIMVVERDGEGTNIFQGDKDTQYNYLKHSELINTEIYLKEYDNKDGKTTYLLKLVIFEKNTEKESTKIPGSVVIRDDNIIIETVSLIIHNIKDFMDLYNKLKNNCFNIMHPEIEIYTDNKLFYHVSKNTYETEDNNKKRVCKKSTRVDKKRLKIFYYKGKTQNISENNDNLNKKTESTCVKTLDTRIPLDYRKKGTTYMKELLKHNIVRRTTKDNKECYIWIMVYLGKKVDIEFQTNLDIGIQPISFTHEEYSIHFKDIIKSSLKFISLVQPLSADKLEEYGEYLNLFFEQYVQGQYEKLSFSVPIPIMNEIITNLCIELTEEGWSWAPDYRKNILQDIKNITIQDLYSVEIDAGLRNLYIKNNLNGVHWITRLKVVLYYIFTNLYNVFSHEQINYLYYTGTTEVLQSLNLTGDKKILAETFFNLIMRFYNVFRYEIAIKMWEMIFSKENVECDSEWIKNWVVYAMEQYIQ